MREGGLADAGAGEVALRNGSLLSITVRSQSEPLANTVGMAKSMRSPLNPPWSLSRCSAIAAWSRVKSPRRGP